MKTKESIIAILLILTLAANGQGNPSYSTIGPQMIRGSPHMGFWGAVPATNANVFDSNWDGRGFQNMYNLNSQTPFAGQRGTGQDAVVPLFTNVGPNRFEFVPVQSNYMSGGQLGAYTYDVNEPRMQDIYRNYARFMNRNLDRVAAATRGATTYQDLNANDLRKLKNPDSFNYANYFDGFGEADTMTGINLPRISHKASEPLAGSARKLLDASAFGFARKFSGENGASDVFGRRRGLSANLELRRLEGRLERISRDLKSIEAEKAERGVQVGGRLRNAKGARFLI